MDERAYLRARLLDLLVGDWDRHQGQWEWVGKADGDAWLPFATDRDMAFADYDGLILSVRPLRPSRAVLFEKDYPNIAGLAWNSREVDRRFLSGLDRAAFQEEAAALQHAITDEVIARGVNRLPGRVPEARRRVPGRDAEGAARTGCRRRRPSSTSCWPGRPRST